MYVYEHAPSPIIIAKSQAENMFIIGKYLPEASGSNDSACVLQMRAR